VNCAGFPHEVERTAMIWYVTGAEPLGSVSSVKVLTPLAPTKLNAPVEGSDLAFHFIDRLLREAGVVALPLKCERAVLRQANGELGGHARRRGRAGVAGDGIFASV